MMLLGVRDRRGNVEAVRVHVGAADVGDTDDHAAGLVEEFRCDRTDVAEALHGDARDARIEPEPRHFVERDERHAATGGLDAAARAADLDRLARDDARHRLVHVHRVGVHEPGHRLRRGADVGRRDVLVGADNLDQFGRVPPRDPLELVLRELRGVAGDAALAAAEWQIHHGALPGHPEGERRDLIERDARVEADPALGRPAREVVLHAVPGEHLERAVVALERDREDELSRGMGENRPHPGVEIEQRRGLIEVRHRVAEDRDVPHRGRHLSNKPRA
jgi:hypothetical protein